MACIINDEKSVLGVFFIPEICKVLVNLSLCRFAVMVVQATVIDFESVFISKDILELRNLLGFSMHADN